MSADKTACDCLPGYGSSGTTCTRCPAGSAGYGGPVGSASCFSCAPGVPTRDQSTCMETNSWSSWGMDIYNRRWNSLETKISPATAPTLTKAWSYSLTTDVSATPTIVGGRMYVPDWSGILYCFNAATGALIWKKYIVDYIAAVEPAAIVGVTNTSIISRTSPAVSGSTMVVGVMKKGGGFPFLLNINIADGSLVWGVRVHDHIAAMVTQSPTVYNGDIYVGISSLEELLADSAGYDCCTFIGEMQKRSLADGALLWRTLMAPDNGGISGGFSGNAVWGSAPAIDPVRQLVYIATGNNYDVPAEISDCVAALIVRDGDLGPNNANEQLACDRLAGGEGNLHNNILALRLDDGALAWNKQLGGPDAWNAACAFKNNPAACPDMNSPDYDFAQAPMLVTACKGKVCRQQVVAGQKSGIVWALSPDNGDVYWWQQAGPGGTVGGLQWGSAADETRIYVSNNNYLQLPLDTAALKAVAVNGVVPATANGGLAMAIDSWTGAIVCSFVNPTPHWANASNNALSQAPMTVANGVLYYASMDTSGVLYYLNAATCAPLGSFVTNATNGCGPSVVDGQVYVGSGYTNFGLGKKGVGIYALALPGSLPAKPAAAMTQDDTVDVAEAAASESEAFVPLPAWTTTADLATPEAAAAAAIPFQLHPTAAMAAQEPLPAAAEVAVDRDTAVAAPAAAGDDGPVPQGRRLRMF